MEHNLLKLRKGWTIRLFKSDWEIVEIANYHWKMDNSSVEYTIFDGHKHAYLEVEFYRGNFEVVFSEAIYFSEDELLEALNKKKIVYNKQIFSYEESYTGDYENMTNSSSRESLECFLFYSKNEDLLTIEKWNDDSLEVFFGKEISSKKIKKIRQPCEL